MKEKAARSPLSPPRPPGSLPFSAPPTLRPPGPPACVVLPESESTPGIVLFAPCAHETPSMGGVTEVRAAKQCVEAQDNDNVPICVHPGEPSAIYHLYALEVRWSPTLVSC